ncbi:MAG: hypothetical protein QM817_08195 [Archangium sp.]
MILEALGLSKGRIWIELGTKACKPGETVRGKLRLELTQARVEARRLAVGLRAEQVAQGVGLQGVTYAFDRMYDESKTLGGARVYKNGEWADFEVMVPTRIRKADLEMRPEPFENNGSYLLGKLTPPTVEPITWEVFALLDRAWGLNVKGHTPLIVLGDPTS